MLKIALAQLNPTVGALEHNTDKIIDLLRTSTADVLVFPELMLSGYPPEDLLLRTDFIGHIETCLDRICAVQTETTAIIGTPMRRKDGLLTNASVVVQQGRIVGYHEKLILPNYGVFDEKRYFVAGEKPHQFTINGVKIALAVCEDLWEDSDVGAGFRQEHSQVVENTHRLYSDLNADLIISINASPFCHGKSKLRREVISRRAKQSHAALLYVNTVGGQDELVFDGQSMAVSSDGKVQGVLLAFKECQALVQLDKGCFSQLSSEFQFQAMNDVEETYHALVLGIKDYAGKNSFKGAILGLSGGIDSSLTLALAVDALGSDNVKAVLMPSRYTSDLSNTEAVKQCEMLGVKYCSLPIIEPHHTFEELIGTQIEINAGDLTSQNIQARCRGVILMAFSNQSGRLLLTTGNKSEMAMGYATLYGDMAGGFAPLKDLPKTWVYRLSNYRNEWSDAIPPEIINRPPSAELAPDQKDSDSLPPYDVLDAILEKYIEEDLSPDKIIAQNFDEATVRKVIRSVDLNEYKRRQSPPGIKITRKAFGRERRYPITSLYAHS